MQNTEELYRPDVVLIGTGMQGIPYIEEILLADAAGLCRFVGVIDAEGALGAGYDALCAAGIPTYRTAEAFFDMHTADLCCIAAPAHLQMEYAVLALRFGCHVLCDGLLGGVLRDWLLVEALAEKEFKFAAVHDVWACSEALCALKRDVDYGFFGKAKHLMMRLYALPGEELLLGAARAIQTMLYLLGPTENASASPAYLDAEHLRVEGDCDVEALVIRMHVSEGAEATLYVMRGCEAVGQAELCFSYERGEIVCGTSSGGELRAALADGSGCIYGVLPGEDTMRGVRAAVAAADADNQRWDLPCTVKNAIPCKRVLAAVENLPVSVVPASLLAAFSASCAPGETAEERALWALLEACSARGCLLSELTGEGLGALRSCLRPEYERWLPDDFMDMRAFATFYEGRPAHRIDEGPTFEERWAALTGAAGKKRGGKRKKK